MYKKGDVQKKIKQFFSYYPERSFYKNDILIWSNEDPEGIFFIENGSVNQYDITKNGKKVVVNRFKSDAFFPMSWAINRDKNEYFYEATEDTEVRLAQADEVVDFILKNPDVTYDLLGRVFRGANGVLRKLAHSMSSTAENRLIYELLTEYRRSRNKKDNKYIMRITEAELSSRTGLARETVSRQMGALIKNNLLSISGGSILILDIKRLESLLYEA